MKESQSHHDAKWKAVQRTTLRRVSRYAIAAGAMLVLVLASMLAKGWRSDDAMTAKDVQPQVDQVIELAPKQSLDSLANTVKLLDAAATELEDQNDVKCWTSFRLLETFIAGCQLQPQTTHFKTAVVQNYLDQIWADADSQTDASTIDADTFRRAAQRIIPWKCNELIDYRVALAGREVTISYHDVQNYRSTVEPIRLVRSLVDQMQKTDPSRRGLTADAIDEVTHLTAVLSTLVLIEANRVAREQHNPSVGDADMREVDRRLAAQLTLKPLESLELHSQQVETDLDDTSQPHSEMLAVARQKIESLESFNTHYSRDKLNETFEANLSGHEKEWARISLDAAAAESYKHVDLTELAEFLYSACAQMHPSAHSLSGAQMLATIQRYYPSVSHFEHGTIHLYPGSQIIEGLKVEEFEADAFRDSGMHWRAIEQMLLKLTPDQEDLPGMDLYALEELSEFLSVFAVAYVKLTGQLVRAKLDTTAVADRAAFKAARRLFVVASGNHIKAIQENSDMETASNNDVFLADVRQSVAASYIDEIFSDVTRLSGIDFRHESSQLVNGHRFAVDGTRPQDIASYVSRANFARGAGYRATVPNHSLGIEGGGVAVADVDGDGLLDVYLVSGARDRLYQNRGSLRFEDVTDTMIPSGLEMDGEGRGAYFVDFDNDGDQDLFVTQVYAPNRLFQNDGDGRFLDVTEKSGLPLRHDLVSHSVVWFDFDNDGFLDVYIGNYGDWLGNELPLVQADSRNGQPNLLYRNNGRGGFEDVTEQVSAGDTGWAQAVSHLDFNQDGWQDIYLANDFGQDVLLVNDRGQGFTKQVVGEGHFLHGMSVGFTDINRDGREDIYVSNISTFSFASKHIKPDSQTRIATSQRTTRDMRMIENNMFLVSTGQGYREQHHAYFNRSLAGTGWAWDADFFDFDNDGAEDLYIANGREPNLSYAYERNVLYKQADGRFYDISQGSGSDFRSNARGVVHADLDLDGDLDLVANNYQDAVVVLRNNLQRNNWVRFRLRGTDSNRDAIGAKVTIHMTDGTETRWVRGGSGFLSKEDNAVHFGLKTRTRVEQVEVVWPSQRKQMFLSLPANQEHLLTEKLGG